MPLGVEWVSHTADNNQTGFTGHIECDDRLSDSVDSL